MELTFEIVTSEKLVTSQKADMVVVPAVEGDIGAMPGHAPVVTELRNGTISLYNDGSITKSWKVQGGILDLSATKCVVLANDIEEL